MVKNLASRLTQSDRTTQSLGQKGYIFDPSAEITTLVDFIAESQECFRFLYKAQWKVYTSNGLAFDSPERRAIDFDFDEKYSELNLNGVKVKINKIDQISFYWNGGVTFSFLIVMNDFTNLYFDFIPKWEKKEQLDSYWNKLQEKHRKEKQAQEENLALK